MNLDYLKLNLIAIILISFLFLSCSGDDDADSIIDKDPGVVVNVNATPKNESVLLEWSNPIDEDFAKTVISYDGKTIEVIDETTTYLVLNLENGKTYTFSLTAIDKAGNSSEITTISAMPDKYVSIYEGKEILLGKYIDNTNDFIDIEINIGSESYLRKTSTSNGNQYFWDGTYKYDKNSGVFTTDVEYYNIDNVGTRRHAAYLVDEYNVAFTFDFKSETRLAISELEKVEGNPNYIDGTYVLKRKTTSSDKESYNETYETTLVCNEKGEYTITRSNSEEVTNGSWTNQDLIDENVIFVTYNSKTYLIINPEQYHILQ